MSICYVQGTKPPPHGHQFVYFSHFLGQTLIQRFHDLPEVTQTWRAECPVHTHPVPPLHSPSSTALASSAPPTPKQSCSWPGLQATPSCRPAALGGLGFRGIDNLAQKEDGVGIGGKDHHKERPVEPKDSGIE